MHSREKGRLTLRNSLSPAQPTELAMVPPGRARSLKDQTDASTTCHHLVDVRLLGRRIVAAEDRRADPTKFMLVVGEVDPTREGDAAKLRVLRTGLDQPRSSRIRPEMPSLDRLSGRPRNDPTVKDAVPEGGKVRSAALIDGRHLKTLALVHHRCDLVIGHPDTLAVLGVAHDTACGGATSCSTAH